MQSYMDLNISEVLTRTARQQEAAIELCFRCVGAQPQAFPPYQKGTKKGNILVECSVQGWEMSDCTQELQMLPALHHFMLWSVTWAVQLVGTTLPTVRLQMGSSTASLTL